MRFAIYPIQENALKPYIQYILFNYNSVIDCNDQVISYPNTNICLGIIRDKQLVDKGNYKTVINKAGISSYLSALYIEPHVFSANGQLDEICIDFTPLGFQAFFPFACKTYILQEDILTEAFGNRAKNFFESVFDMPDFSRRGRVIELYLLKLIRYQQNFQLAEPIGLIHYSNGDTTLNNISKQTKISQKKIYRLFNEHLNICPKQYSKIVRFRKALALLKRKNLPFTVLALECGYTDSSHMTKDFLLFTGIPPARLKERIYTIDHQVIISHNRDKNYSM